jgi:hypothetical protein
MVQLIQTTDENSKQPERQKGRRRAVDHTNTFQTIDQTGAAYYNSSHPELTTPKPSPDKMSGQGKLCTMHPLQAWPTQPG